MIDLKDVIKEDRVKAVYFEYAPYPGTKPLKRYERIKLPVTNVEDAISYIKEHHIIENILLCEEYQPDRDYYGKFSKETRSRYRKSNCFKFRNGINGSIDPSPNCFSRKGMARFISLNGMYISLYFVMSPRKRLTSNGNPKITKNGIEDFGNYVDFIGPRAVSHEVKLRPDLSGIEMVASSASGYNKYGTSVDKPEIDDLTIFWNPSYDDDCKKLKEIFPDTEVPVVYVDYFGKDFSALIWNYHTTSPLENYMQFINQYTICSYDQMMYSGTWFDDFCFKYTSFNINDITPIGFIKPFSALSFLYDCYTNTLKLDDYQSIESVLDCGRGTPYVTLMDSINKRTEEYTWLPAWLEKEANREKDLKLKGLL